MRMIGEEGRGSRAVAHGDEAAFADMYPALRRFAAVVGSYQDDPDDLVQEALARMLAVGGLSVAREPGAYLRTAIVRIASNDRRRAARGQRMLNRLTWSQDESPQYPSDLADLLGLSPVDRAVIYLAVIDGVRHKEIAAQLSLSEWAVRKRLSRSLHRLRADLIEETDHE
jgi:RNA polymerase sigma factor (sigma-70 family)